MVQQKEQEKQKKINKKFNKQLKQTPIIFSIDLKVNGKIIILNVQENDSISVLLTKHQIGSQQNPTKFNQIKQKIKSNIQKQIQLKQKSKQFELANKLKLFLEKEDQQFKIIQNQPNKPISEQQTPVKILLEHSNFKELVKKDYFQNNQIKQEQISEEDKQNLNKTQILQEIINFENQNNIKSQIKTFQNGTQKKKLNKKADEDLIKAYEIILKKSKDKTMREMAQSTLKQLDLLKSQNKSHQIIFHETKPQQKMSSLRTEISSVKELSSNPNELQFKQINVGIKKNRPALLKTNQVQQNNSFVRKTKGYSYSTSTQRSDKYSLVYSYKQNQSQNNGYNYQIFPQNAGLKVNYNSISTENHENGNILNRSIRNAPKRYKYLID